MTMPGKDVPAGSPAGQQYLDAFLRAYTNLLVLFILLLPPKPVFLPQLLQRVYCPPFFRALTLSTVCVIPATAAAIAFKR